MNPATTGSSAQTRYRADIDGLRALAVLAVVFTHAGVPGFGGGYVGVDIFFVISGYLIHRDLRDRVADGRFAIIGFYGRRLRRTLPALFVLVAMVLAVSAAVLMPGDLSDAARSAIGAVLLVPNIVFLTQTGYFDTAAASKPLLHTWSLGVEEQFYLLAPLLAWTLRPMPASRRPLALLAALALTLAFAVLLQAMAPDAAFYLMPSRAFEFLSGALVAEALAYPIRTAWRAEAIAACGLVGLLLSLVVFAHPLPHPGWPTLLPCLSTAVLLHVGATRRTLANRVLAFRGLAFIGLISYSLYLWHWPILVISRYAEWPITWRWRASEAVLLAALAVASWRFIEQPFRKVGSPWRERAPILIPITGATIAACAVATVAFDGWPARFSPEIAAVAGYSSYRDTKPFREGQCFITSKNSLADFDRRVCLSLAADKPNVLLIGDSHAAHLWTGLRDAWPKVNFLQATVSGCKPVLAATGAGRCTALMADMLERFIPAHRPDAVILAGLWDDTDIAALRRTVEAVGPDVGRVIVFGPMPRYDEPVATLIARHMLHGTLDVVRTHLLPDTAALDARMRAALAPVATYISPHQALCAAGNCRLFTSAGIPMQFDYHHLTAPGAAALMADIKAQNPDLFTRRTEARRSDD